MVYLGDNWPARYRNGVFMCNLHGNRVNHDLLEPRGSGYVARHGKDFLFANDPWFRGLAVRYGPDGGVFVSDWCDTGECHNYVIADRSNGRIYKVTYGKPNHRPEDLAKLGDAELVRRQLHPNDWHVRHARRLLQERAAAGKLSPETHGQLREMLRDNADVTRKLRALWALHVTGGLDEKQLLTLFDSPHEYVRGWAIQLGLEGCQPSAAFRDRLAELAEKDPSPVVRLFLASGLQRLPLAERWPVGARLARHAEDAADANLPLLLWYAVEPLVPADPDRAAGLLAQTKIPLLREYLARRAVFLGDGLHKVLGVVEKADDAALARDVLRGIDEALTGQRQAPMPANWPAVAARLSRSTDREVRERAQSLGALFGDAQALADLRKTAADPAAAPRDRRRALRALVYKKEPELLPLLQALLKDRALRGPAIRGLAAYDAPSTPPALLGHYGSFTDEEKADAVQTLAQRPAYALALLGAVEKGQVPRRDLSAFTARQLLGLKQPAVTDKLGKVWGTIRPASQEKEALLARYKRLLTPAYLKRANPAAGRVVFRRTCAACHKLFDDGGAVGPELTGAQRTNLDYVLENLLDPSALVFSDYQVTAVELKDGRVLNGIVKQWTAKAIALQTQNEIVYVPKTDIEAQAKSPLSLMPDGLLTNLKDEEVRDLIAYLAGLAQVPLPPSAK
jgi:putative heme-binding domain-containing protein